MKTIRFSAAVSAAVATTLALGAQGPEPIGRSTERFITRVAAGGLEGPWEIAYGPDAHLWITERVARRVVRINPADGSRTVLVTIPEVTQSVGQDGILGLALHPDLLRGTGSDFVYVSYTYGGAAGVSPQLKVRRYRFESKTRTLVEPADILTGLPSGDDHVSGRLAIGPDRKLYLSIGDLGANFARNRCMANRAQDLPTAAQVGAGQWSSYAGKILRIELDGSIPADNPTIDGVRSHVFSYGHRNVLGLAFGPAGLLYATEHGPDTDDEVNLIEPGGNYGWPRVAGFRDDKAYVYANWSASSPDPCASLPERGPIPASVPTQAETAWNHARFTPPLRTFFTFDSVAEARKAGGGTIAPGGLGVSTANAVPGWGDSLLVLSMLKGVAYRVPLGANGRSVEEPPVEVFKTTNRYRDIAEHPTGRIFYIATDPAGRTADDNGAPTTALANPGSVLEFTYREPG